MTSEPSGQFSKVERFPSPASSRVISDELNRILTLLREECPRDAHVSFDFDGRLHVHIDVRNREDVAIVEMKLSVLGVGLFHSVSRSATPHHPFFHRVSAVVDR